jgi:probable F420-dependent oxidoreductase
MGDVRAFRFGVVVKREPDWPRVGAFARRVESEGFSTLLAGDHFFTPICSALLAIAAEATETLRLGSYVYNNDFRHPAVLAKEAATLDVLSGGRFELGMGAGWLRAEYDQIGLAFDPPNVRVARFEEAVGVIRRLLVGSEVSHDGPHYSFERHRLAPQPVQDRVPLLVGAGGRRMVELAARDADIVSFVARASPEGGVDASDVTPLALDAKVSWLEDALSDSARDDRALERCVEVSGVFSSVEEIDETFWMSASSAATSPFTLVGDTSALVDVLYERRERWGVSYVTCFDQDLEKMVPVVQRLAGVE